MISSMTFGLSKFSMFCWNDSLYHLIYHTKRVINVVKHLALFKDDGIKELTRIIRGNLGLFSTKEEKAMSFFGATFHSQRRFKWLYLTKSID